MSAKSSIAILLTVAFDCIGAVLLLVYGLFIGPLGFLRGPLVIERFFWYLGVFVPMRVLARAIRVGIDWRLGHFEVAIVQAESLISAVEEYYRLRPKAAMRKRVLMDLYALLARAYMHTGRIDEAMQVVIRARKVLGVDCLIGLGELDAKTAHLVRAGLAAGRLLEGGGLATMFVKTDFKPAPAANGAAAVAGDKNDKSSKPGAKIIPFPPNNYVV